MEIEVEVEGKVQKVQIDPDKLGFVPADKVDQIRSQSFAQGAKSKETEFEPVKQTLAEREKALEDAQKALDAAKQGGGKNAIELEQTRQQIAELQSQIKSLAEAKEAETKARKEATLSAQISQQAGKMPFREGTTLVFEQMAKASLQEIDGIVLYRLADGTPAPLEDWAKEWAASPVGKSLLLTDQRPGAGTYPAGSGSVSADSPMEQKARFIQEHGLDAFKDKISAQLKRKTG